MGLVTKTQPPLIGVDISSTAVKLLQLSRAGDRYRVEHYAVEPLPPNAVIEKNLVEVEAVGEAIRRAIARSGTRVKHAAAAVSGSSVITKTMPMPADLDEDDMESQVELEAVNYIPYPIEEVNLDFEVLGPMPGNSEMVQVLLAASRSENVGGIAPSSVQAFIFRWHSCGASTSTGTPKGQQISASTTLAGGGTSAPSLLSRGRLSITSNINGKAVTAPYWPGNGVPSGRPTHTPTV